MALLPLMQKLVAINLKPQITAVLIQVIFRIEIKDYTGFSNKLRFFQKKERIKQFAGCNFLERNALKKHAYKCLRELNVARL